jgi:hypothetical protein
LLHCYDRLVDVVEAQLNCYEELTGKNPELHKKLEDISLKGAVAVMEFESAIDTMVGDMQDYFLKIFSAVEDLSHEFRNPLNYGFSAENINTLHDMIRYLNQKSIDSMFNQGFPMEHGELHYTGRYDELYLVNLSENVDKRASPLQPILEFYSKKPSKVAYETWKILYDKDYINARIDLGCHLDAVIGDLPQNNYISLKYKEFFDSKNRVQYLQNVLEKLGFKTNTTSKDTLYLHARIENKSKKELTTTLSEVVRLLASNALLDLGSGLAEDEIPLATESFFKGVTNMYEYLSFVRYLDKRKIPFLKSIFKKYPQLYQHLKNISRKLPFYFTTLKGAS